MSEETQLHTGRPSVLLAEDDPVSALFISEALQEMGLSVECHARGPSALAQAQVRIFDLMILDCRMPGMGAEDILKALRSAPASACHDRPAIASSADLPPTLRTRLHQIGFVATLHKPVLLDDLEQVVRQALPGGLPGGVLDHVAGARSCGDARTLDALRGLFAQELDTLSAQLDDLLVLGGDTLRDRLHRLRASCGLCGAMALDQACRQLQEAIRCADPQAVRNASDGFRQALNSTRIALRGHEPSTD
ncbi:response regulator [Oleiagrimonas sp.]|jgi:two-component system OmpR family response regulator|uniref:Hpt domain-containing response regulator n=1 Tax=Oleiagrimonas sp. TaxID=2010330 RepID=UPI0026148AB3|nr:response regulator [Oleiagrimonas sp.]MDA3913696.1 response regulator [Oleiagrimonas sp.]